MHRPTDPTRLRALALLALPLVFACTNGGDGGGSDNPSQTEDRFAFVIPQSLEQDLAVSAGPLALQGELLDLGGTGLPEEVEWSVQQPGGIESGDVDVNDDGSFSAELPLATGDNQVVLTVEGTDAESSFTVTLNPGYTFGGQLQVSPDVVYVNEPREVTAAIALQDLETDTNSVEIVRIDDGMETVLGMLADDGNLANGDEIEGDGIFTGRFFLTETETGQVDVRAVVQMLNTPDEARSESFPILSTERLLQADLDEILNRQGDLQERMDQAALAGTLDTEVTTIITELEQTAGIAQVGPSDSGRGVYVVYENGISGVLYSSVTDQRSAPQVRGQRLPGPNRR